MPRVDKAPTVAFAGNPNCGKTTIFNLLTGMRQQVGNWPGVTVEKKEGIIRVDKREVVAVDLPGIYGLSAASIDERIARDFLLRERPAVVVDILDASNLERNLYLTVELLEMGTNLVVALNMVDIAKEQGLMVDDKKLALLLGVPVVRTIGNKGVGKEELLRTLAQRLGYRPTGLKVDYGEDIERAIASLAGRLHLQNGFASRWLALKLLEGDEDAARRVKQLGEWKVLQEVGRLREHLTERLGHDPAIAIAEARYKFIERIVAECASRREVNPTLAEKADNLLLHRIWGFPIFVLIFWGLFQFVFRVGAPVGDAIGAFFEWIAGKAEAFFASVHAPAWIVSFVNDGLIGGLGTLIEFVPYIILLFIGIAVLEDTGYIARAAFVTDKFMSKIGLHGRAFIPMLIGFGCNVPAIMSTRTLEDERDRLISILVNPFIPCGARLPVFVLIAGAFFGARVGSVVFGVMALGALVAALSAKLFSKTLFKGESSPFVMELPPYRFPTFRGIWISASRRTSLFIKKAGTVIVLGVVLIWALGTLPLGVEYASEDSFAGKLGHMMSPVLKPLGLEWREGTALIFGFVAKEVVIAGLGVLYHASEENLATALRNSLSPASALAFMVFTLLYIPCVATIAAIYKEAGGKWALFAVLYGLIIAWITAFIVYRVALLSL